MENVLRIKAPARSARGGRARRSSGFRSLVGALLVVPVLALLALNPFEVAGKHEED